MYNEVIMMTLTIKVIVYNSLHVDAHVINDNDKNELFGFPTRQALTCIFRKQYKVFKSFMFSAIMVHDLNSFRIFIFNKIRRHSGI